MFTTASRRFGIGKAARRDAVAAEVEHTEYRRRLHEAQGRQDELTRAGIRAITTPIQ